jgi:hypothetical protein
MQVDTRASAAWWAPDNSSLLALLHHRYPQLATQCQDPGTTHPSEPQASGLANQLAPGGFPPTEHGGPAPSTVPDSKRALTPPSKNKNARFPTEERKAKTATLQAAPEAPFPQGTQEPSASHCTSLQENQLSSVQKLESWLLHQVAICCPAGARSPTTHSAQRPSTPSATAGEPLHPH